MIFGLASRNLARRPGRALLLVLAVAVSSSALLASLVLLLGLQRGLERGLSRLGADLCVVAPGALVNPTASLLVGEMGQPALSASQVTRVRALPGVAVCAPQRVLRLSDPDFCGESSSELVLFDPASDFTVLPWVEEGHMARPFSPGDVIVGCRHPFAVGESVLGLTVWGRLACSGVGPHERGLFVSFADASRVSVAPGQDFAPSVLLLRLAPGFTPESIRFALSDLRVVEAGPGMTGVRQSVVALLQGVLCLCLVMLVVICLMIAVVFSAVVGERRFELGVLMAVGLSSWRLVGLLAAEAGLATGLGGVLGLLGAWGWLRLAEHTFLASMDFVWPCWGWLVGVAVVSLGVSVLVGVLGALQPAMALGQRDPYELMRGEA